MLTSDDKKWLCALGYCIVRAVVFCMTSQMPNNHWKFIRQNFDRFGEAVNPEW